MRSLRWLAPLTTLALLLLSVTTVSADHSVGVNKFSYTLDWDGRRVPAPLGYIYQDDIDGINYPTGAFKDPADIFLDKQQRLYVVDRGNSRVLVFGPDKSLLMEVGTQGEGKLNQPEGIFVNEQGEMFVADTGNSRIVKFSPSGQYLREFGKPRSNLLEEEANYKPSKLVLDKRGYIYVIESGGDYRGILILDTNGIFRGFFAANPVGFSLQRWFARIFATEQQKKQLSKVRPTHHSNLLIDDRGFIYTTSPFANTDQIKKLTSIGTNTYKSRQPGGRFGEVERRGGQVIQPRFIDVAVDEYGIVSALDFNSGKVYQYDPDGNLLNVFGGKAWQRGLFGYPASIAAGPNGVLYILDAERNNVQIFRPTEFARLVQRASVLHYDGRYAEAAELWREVLRLDTNYILAHYGIGKAYFKEERWDEALREFYLAHNKVEYSRAFAMARHQYARENFGLVMLYFGLVLAGLYGLYRVVRWLLARPLPQYIYGG
jgi:DNA-binding beta-propeller fold protein YncE